MNKTAYQITKGYNKNITIAVSGYYSKNCQTKNN
jgi:hypothetical protein